MAAAVADLTGDGKPELLVGNYAGGVAFFRGTQPPAHTSVIAHENPTLRVYPNPATDFLHIESDQPLNHIVVYDSYGRLVLSVGNVNKNSTIINTKTLSPGVYIICLDNSSISKFLKSQ